MQNKIREGVSFRCRKTSGTVLTVFNVETALFAAPRISNPISALTPSDHPLDSGCASPRVTPKVEEGGEDDIPVSVRNSFKELRSVKDELERQVRATFFSHTLS
jgi:hypothetical protein